MSIAHDQGSGIAAAASEIAADPLTDVLRSVKLKGAQFFMVDVSSPWCVEVPEIPAFADIILPAARHVVSYHIVVEGHGFAAGRRSRPG